MPSWQEMEQHVRNYLTECFQRPFSKKTLLIPWGSEEPMPHEFDAVSDDESIVAEVKHIKGGQAAQLQRISIDFAHLMLLSGKEHKLMFITDPVGYWAFCRDKFDLLMRNRRHDAGVDLVSPMEFLEWVDKNS